MPAAGGNRRLRRKTTFNVRARLAGKNATQTFFIFITDLRRVNDNSQTFFIFILELFPMLIHCSSAVRLL